MRQAAVWSLQTAADCALAVWLNVLHLPVHALFDHSEVAISDDLANLVFFRDDGSGQVAINCLEETEVTTGLKQDFMFHKMTEALAESQQVLRLNYGPHTVSQKKTNLLQDTQGTVLILMEQLAEISNLKSFT